MPLGNVRAFWDWIARDDPPFSKARLVEDWIAEVADRPQAAPSTPIDEMSNQPTYEVRWATVPGTDVEVFYQHSYEAGIVDLFWVGPPGTAGDLRR